jgi:hypothetical protein
LEALSFGIAFDVFIVFSLDIVWIHRWKHVEIPYYPSKIASTIGISWGKNLVISEMGLNSFLG